MIVSGSLKTPIEIQAIQNNNKDSEGESLIMRCRRGRYILAYQVVEISDEMVKI
jgi:hypothetical protein